MHVDVITTLFTFRLLLKINATPPPRRPEDRETCSILYPSGTRSCKICLSLSWPSQVSVRAMMSTSLDIMKSAIDKRLFATERQFRVTIMIIFVDCSLDELCLLAPDYVGRLTSYIYLHQITLIDYRQFSHRESWCWRHVPLTDKCCDKFTTINRD